MGWGTYALWFVRILFACRVSLISVVAGALLFAFATPARDLFADVTYGALPGAVVAWGHWLWFFALLILVWAFPAHYAARRLLYTDEWMFSRRIRAETDPAKAAAVKKRLRGSIDWIPRGLAVVPYIAVLIGLWKAHRVVADTMALAPARQAFAQILTLVGLDVLSAAVFVAFLLGRRVWFRNMSTAIVNGLAWTYILIVTALFLASVIRPFFPADIAPRAAIVPLVFGSFVFAATYLAWASHKTGIPVLALSALAALGVTALNTRFNDMRTFERAAADYSRRQVDIDTAVDEWKAANCDARACPPALIVAAEGGASRAAFAAATAVGELLDRAGELPDAKGREIAPARRIFAISGVSGGAFGAATIRTALADLLERGQSAPPCLRPPNEWFEAAAGDVKASWRSCLQALVSGDYLTPAFVGLAFRDNFSPPNPFASGSPLFPDDRAALVERAFERHYDHVVRGEIPSFWGQVLQDLAPAGQEKESGLRRRFGFVADKLSPPGAWLPLLLLNGASVNTGARIIASDLISTRAAPASDGRPAGRVSLYSAAFDVLEMLSKRCPPDKVVGRSCAIAHDGSADEPGARSGPDIRLSTAAMLSARFPIISPAGIDPRRGRRFDRRSRGRRRLFRERRSDDGDGRRAGARAPRDRPGRPLGAEQSVDGRRGFRTRSPNRFRRAPQERPISEPPILRGSKPFSGSSPRRSKRWRRPATATRSTRRMRPRRSSRPMRSGLPRRPDRSPPTRSHRATSPSGCSSIRVSARVRRRHGLGRNARLSPVRRARDRRR